MGTKKIQFSDRGIFVSLLAIMILCFVSPVFAATPRAEDDSVSTIEDNRVVIAVKENDFLGDEPTVIKRVASPSHGTVMFDEHSIIYTPEADFNGVDHFNYMISDKDANVSAAMVKVKVLPVNDPPVALDDDATVEEGGTLNVAPPGLLENDTDMDGDMLTVNTTPVSGLSHGALTLNTDGSYEYIHNGTETTSDTFVYRVSDGHGGMDTAIVTITITKVR